MKREEIIMAAVFVISIALWATSQFTGFDATLIALAGATILLVTQAMSWTDVLEEKGAWDTMVWIGTLVSLTGLSIKVCSMRFVDNYPCGIFFCQHADFMQRGFCAVGGINRFDADETAAFCRAGFQPFSR